MLEDLEERLSATLGEHLERMLRDSSDPQEGPKEECFSAAKRYCFHGKNPMLYARIKKFLDGIPKLMITSSGHVFAPGSTPETDEYEAITTSETQALYSSITRRLESSIEAMEETKRRKKGSHIKPLSEDDFAGVIEGWIRDAYSELRDECDDISPQRMEWRRQVSITHMDDDLFSAYKTRKPSTFSPRTRDLRRQPDWDSCYRDLEASFPVIQHELERALRTTLREEVGYAPPKVNLRERPPLIEVAWGDQNTVEGRKTRELITPTRPRAELDGRIDDICERFGMDWKSAFKAGSLWIDTPYKYTLIPNLDPYKP